MSATPLTLLSSMATREVLAELCAIYWRSTGQEVRAAAAGGVDVAKRVGGGEAVDVVVLADNAIDALIAGGRVADGSKCQLAKSGVAIAVAKGARRYPIADEAQVKQAVLTARTLSFSTGPSGVYLEQLFERWGILGEIRERIVVPPPGTPVGSLVESGRVELGFQQLSELKNIVGIEILGPLPAAIQTTTVFSAGVTAMSARPEAARALLTFLSSAAAAPIKVSCGMDAA